ncbi:hypothetical protein HDU98_009503 [Podochytrium sp. JEL0797]|nr:hypothetical protein HDU98_009503 [Podochytrium sp. JEL0797]
MGDYDTLLTLASDFESKGTRYIDGPKARNFFEKALQNYILAKENTKDAFVLANCGRLQLLLAEFSFPSYPVNQQRALLKDAVKNLADAVQVDKDNQDALFNLAQALKAQFERVLDTGDSVTHTHFERLSEADSLLERLFALQLADFEKANALATSTVSEESCEPGCAHDHEHSHSHATDQRDSTNDSMMEDGNDAGEEGFEMVDQVEPVTESTLVETLVAHAELLTLAASSLYSISQEQAEQLYFKADSKLTATTPFWSITSPDNEPSEVSLARAALFVSRGESLFESSPKTEPNSAPWKSLFEQASTMYDSILSRHPTCAESPADKGDLLCTWADCLMTVTIGCSGVPGFEALTNTVLTEKQQSINGGGSSSSSSQPPTLSAQTFLTTIRQIYSRASKSYTLAQTLDPKKPNLPHRLGDLDATRTSLYPPSLDPANAQTQLTLLSNASTHYTRALSVLGVSTSLLSAVRPCADEDAARGSLFGLAKVLSHFEGREGDVKNALVCWKRRGGVLGDESTGEGCGIVFGERVLGLEWFGKVVG